MDESSTSVEEINSKRHLLKTVDVLDREVIPTPNAYVINIFSDGTSEKKMSLIEHAESTQTWLL